ncbi:lysozyme inhibitor LprI family protein [Paenibacillus crassostreae]|uniref:Lysozyme inhibitor LprI-like N-terminal domain-containing protein n=1 Tax=Paenibacillus crassostreae TaxID=1763538 RepID=A0A167GC84_9BACL|nr:lysozyme inhibitor LprI family protein [Paenibacillus crassostreae]AOZ92666.1 hypothetical protein LPB68_10840 [Paenibacillus crassostreae]OAB77435.1 hypothetical protein PNBC_01835 [Paenibacillus crassostreae]
MKKWLTATLLTCIFLSGCSNVSNEGMNTKQPENTEQEIKVPEEVEQQEEVKEEVKQEEVKQEEAPIIEEETTAVETKDEYIQKLNEIEEGLADLQDLYNEGTTVSMTAAADETYKRWDAALNEIYNDLKQQLSTSEMAKLKQEQLDWITSRDETAKEESLEYEGGTMESLQYILTLSRVTKERCYELVDLYMK